MTTDRSSPLRQLAFDSATSGLVIVDTAGPDQPIVDVNTAFESISGYTRAEVIGRNCRFLQGPETDQTAIRQLRDAIAMKRPLTTTIINYRKDGTAFWNELRVAPMEADGDDNRYYIGVQSDVTAQWRATLRVEILAEASAILGSTMSYDSTLEAVARLLLEQIADHCSIDIIEDGATRRIVDVGADIASEPQHSVAPTMVSTLNVPMSARGSSLGTFHLATVDPEGFDHLDRELANELAARIGSTIDSARLFADASAAVRARDQFLSIAAHELRTPVSGVKGYAQLLLRAGRRGDIDPERLRRSLEAIVDATDRLQVLTDDLLDVSRIRSGRLPLRTRRMEFNEMIQDVVLRYVQTFRMTHRLALTVADESCWVNIDIERMQQVVMSLIENAVKHSSEDDPIVIRIVRDGPRIAFEISDGGIGVSPEYIDQLFRPFARAPNAIDRNIPGLGLGLYIIRGIIARHGGKIWADSMGDGEGARFGFSLTCQSDPAEDATAPPGN